MCKQELLAISKGKNLNTKAEIQFDKPILVSKICGTELADKNADP